MSFVYCVNCTLPMQDCICQYAPNLKLNAAYTLLVHPTEFGKRSNTGRLLKMATDINSVTWHRLKNEQFARQFRDYAIFFPDNEVSPSIEALGCGNSDSFQVSNHAIKGYLIIDATWQQARKILRQSPWLAKLPRVSVSTHTSQYQLRRNQTEQGLSTLECLAYWLGEQNQRNCSQELLQFLDRFQHAYLKARQAGQLK